MGFSALRAGGPVMVPLLLLSIAVVAVGVERFGYWRGVGLLTQRPERRLLEELRSAPDPQARQARQELHLLRLESAMAEGEPLLEAAALIAPLLGLIGTVQGLMGVLAALGPQLTLPSGGSLIGYSQVLVSTLSGLVIALIATALLRTNQALRHWLRQRLEQAALADALGVATGDPLPEPLLQPLAMPRGRP